MKFCVYKNITTRKAGNKLNKLFQKNHNVFPLLSMTNYVIVPAGEKIQNLKRTTFFELFRLSSINTASMNNPLLVSSCRPFRVDCRLSRCGDSLDVKVWRMGGVFHILSSSSSALRWRWKAKMILVLRVVSVAHTWARLALWRILAPGRPQRRLRRRLRRRWWWWWIDKLLYRHTHSLTPQSARTASKNINGGCRQTGCCCRCRRRRRCRTSKSRAPSSSWRPFSSSSSSFPFLHRCRLRVFSRRRQYKKCENTLTHLHTKGGAIRHSSLDWSHVSPFPSSAGSVHKQCYRKGCERIGLSRKWIVHHQTRPMGYSVSIWKIDTLCVWLPGDRWKF